MTKQELHEKYKGMPPREYMTAEQERELVSDLFAIYEEEGFSTVFWSQGGDYPQYHGQPFTVVCRSNEENNKCWSVNLSELPKWHIRFADGFEMTANPDEIIPSIMRDNGCPEKYLTGGIKKAAIRNLNTNYIHVCPNHCEVPLSTTAHVAQTWKVDPFGNFVEEISTDMITQEPGNGNIWECTECGAEAELIECRKFSIKSFGILCLPTTPRGCAFWVPCGMTAAQYIPIMPDGRDIPTLTIEGQVFYLRDFE